jgi:hypothetical protein
MNIQSATIGKPRRQIRVEPLRTPREKPVEKPETPAKPRRREKVPA